VAGLANTTLIDINKHDQIIIVMMNGLSLINAYLLNATEDRIALLGL
jgi:hypothetical protein